MGHNVQWQSGGPQGRASFSVSRFRAGDWVEVRSPDEIMSTLESDAALDGLPFMPEMLQYCGRRFRVSKSAHKTCDTIESYVIRRMSNAVHLEGLRCDGSAHGGCQAGCLLFWKDAWLKPVDAGTPALEVSASFQVSDITGIEVLSAGTRIHSTGTETLEVYRCQATELLRATSEVRRRDRWDPRFYFHDLRSGNVTLLDFLWFGVIAIFNSFMTWSGGRRYPHLCGLAGQKTPAVELGISEGEFVTVRSKSQITRTLNSNLRNRGLFFDYEMVPYCENGPYKVIRRVERIINEKTGHMMKLPNPCVILDGVTCGGKLSSSRMFCPRAVYPYWHEIWLERANASDSKS